jgi:putative tricarboxylic transport membrane protein
MSGGEEKDLGSSRRKWGDVFVSLSLIGLGVGVAIRAAGLHVGTAIDPQPGFFPFFGGAILTILSVILLLMAWTGNSVGIQAFGSIGRPAVIILGLIVYVVIFDWVGYVIATTILSAIMLWASDTKRWRVIVLVSLTVAIATHILFDRVLSVPLPNGILGRFF